MTEFERVERIRRENTLAYLGVEDQSDAIALFCEQLCMMYEHYDIDFFLNMPASREGFYRVQLSNYVKRTNKLRGNSNVG